LPATYVEHLDRSWERAKRMLFRPFRLETWLVLGFAAFLSDLGRGGGNAGGGWRWTDRVEAETVVSTIHDFLHRPLVPLLLAVAVVLLIVLGIVLL
jgi:hypothetical protein